MNNPRRIVFLAIAVVVVMVAALVVVRALTKREAPLTAAEFEGGDEIAKLFEGIPQDGALLGDPSAPVRVVVYVDFKCPHCADASVDVVPRLVSDYVRPGKVVMQLKPLAFLAPDSGTGAWAASAAARQDKMWQFSELMLRNQGDPATTWLTSDYVGHAATVAGVDDAVLLRDMKTPAVRARLTADQRDAELVEARTTPFWVVTGPRGRQTVAGNFVDQVVAAIEDVSPEPAS